ncbi:hypothetical protein BT69DRAFT_1294812 [Atractiella rhizophila]|nr:hypothetical protein BT69DRAFT_1294812 [Atractiella rhizophila]
MRRLGVMIADSTWIGVIEVVSDADGRAIVIGHSYAVSVFHPGLLMNQSCFTNGHLGAGLMTLLRHDAQSMAWKAFTFLESVVRHSAWIGNLDVTRWILLPVGFAAIPNGTGPFCDLCPVELMRFVQEEQRRHWATARQSKMRQTIAAIDISQFGYTQPDFNPSELLVVDIKALLQGRSDYSAPLKEQSPNSCELLTLAKSPQSALPLFCSPRCPSVASVVLLSLRWNSREACTQARRQLTAVGRMALVRASNGAQSGGDHSNVGAKVWRERVVAQRAERWVGQSFWEWPTEQTWQRHVSASQSVPTYLKLGKRRFWGIEENGIFGSLSARNIGSKTADPLNNALDSPAVFGGPWLQHFVAKAWYTADLK